MDISKEYFEMCIAAHDLQKYKINQTDYFEAGDFFYEEQDEYDPKHIIVSRGEQRLHNSVGGNITWMPRVDQLMQMIETWNHKYPRALFDHLVANSEYKGINKFEEQTVEKYLLRFLMTDRFNLTWDPTTKTWIKKKESEHISM